MIKSIPDKMENRKNEQNNTNHRQLPAIFYGFYQAAYTHLLANNLRQMQNPSELHVFYAPLKVTVGEDFSLEELTNYLVEAG